MIETLIIAGVLVASAILIYAGIRQAAREDQEVLIRRMARTLVRSVEKRAQWDSTLHSTQLKWARIVLVLKAEFDIDDDWLHIIIGEAQFDMEADNGRNSTRGSKTDPGRGTGDDQGRDVGSGIDSERHSSDSRDSVERVDDGESFGGTEFFDSGEDLPIPSAE